MVQSNSLYDKIREDVLDKRTHCHIYTRNGKLYTITNYNNCIYYYDNDVDIIYDNLIKFTLDFFNNLDVVYVEINQLSDVQKGIIYLADLTKPVECIFGSLDDIPIIG